MRIGGYRDIPLMEDVDLMRRLRAGGDRIFIIHEKVKTSARRWEQEGVLRSREELGDYAALSPGRSSGEAG